MSALKTAINTFKASVRVVRCREVINFGTEWLNQFCSIIMIVDYLQLKELHFWAQHFKHSLILSSALINIRFQLLKVSEIWLVLQIFKNKISM